MKIQFQYYPANVKSNNPLGFVTLEYFLKSTKQPKNNILNIFNKIKEAEANGDNKLKSELKQNNLFYFTPCVIIDNYRRYDNIVNFTGLAVLDFDHIDKANDLKHIIFNKYQSVVAAWLSPSKRGVKALVNIPVVNSVDEFKQYYYGLAAEMETYEGFDSSGQNSVLPLFQSYDPELLQRQYTTIWKEKGLKIDDFSVLDPIEAPDIKTTEYDTKRVINIIKSGMSNITDNGHPQLRGLAFAVGGYVATGYIDSMEAEQLMHYIIQDHPYLKKGVKGYKLTVSQMIEKGKQRPIILD